MVMILELVIEGGGLEGSDPGSWGFDDGTEDVPEGVDAEVVVGTISLVCRKS